jgi:hypothetical protein
LHPPSATKEYLFAEGQIAPIAAHLAMQRIAITVSGGRNSVSSPEDLYTILTTIASGD